MVNTILVDRLKIFGPFCSLSLSFPHSLVMHFRKVLLFAVEAVSDQHFSFTSKLPDATKNNQQQWNYQTKLNTKHTEKDQKIKKKQHTQLILYTSKWTNAKN